MFTSFEDEPPAAALPEWAKFLCFQREAAPETGRLHWQGFVQLVEKKRISFLKNIPGWGTFHLEPRRGTAEEAVRYCSPDALKDGQPKPGVVPGSYRAFGVPTRAGVTSDYDSMINALKKRPCDFVRDDYLGPYIKHKRAVDDYLREEKSRDVSVITIHGLDPDNMDTWHPWQKDLYWQLQQPVNHRQVIWISDPGGSNGKTQFGNFLIKFMRALFVTTTARERVVPVMRSHPPIVLIDIKRSEADQDKVGYGTMEMIKDGVGFNTMYNPSPEYWPSPHLVVFANFYPDKTKLTDDRWLIFGIDPATKTLHNE